MSEEMKVKKYTPRTYEGYCKPWLKKNQPPIIRAVEHHEQVVKPRIKEIERMIKYKSPQEVAIFGFKIPKEAVKSDNVSLITRIIRTCDNIGKIIKANPLKLLKTIMVR